MTKIDYQQRASTYSSIGAGIVIAGAALLTSPNREFDIEYPREQEALGLTGDMYRETGHNATFGQYPNPFTGGYSFAVKTFEVEIANFYADLLANQEPLGEEFARVLYENLGDLYEE